MPSLLVTNDFPPKVGGIQSYLYELWRRLPPDETTVLTTPYDGRGRVRRARRRSASNGSRERVLLPTPAAGAARRRARARGRRRRRSSSTRCCRSGWSGRACAPRRTSSSPTAPRSPCPGGCPGARALARRVLRGAAGVVAAGSTRPRGGARRRDARCPAWSSRRASTPTGSARSTPTSAASAPRAGSASTPSVRVVLGVSRLVPAQGLRRAARRRGAALGPDVQVVIAGAGATGGASKRGAPARPGRPGTVPRPGARRRPPRAVRRADVFAMPCRDRWGGLEAEGFGIVFLEAAACGVPRSRVAAGARTRRSSTARPASSSIRATCGAAARRARRRCSTTRRGARRWARRRGRAAVRELRL